MYIDTAEFLSQYKLLYEDLFKDLDKYAEQFYENQHEYLSQLLDAFKSAHGAAIALLEKEVQKYEDLESKEKEVFEEEKTQNEKKIKALNKEIKALDKSIRALQEQQDAIRDNDIKPLEDTIKERQKIVDFINEEVELMEKARETRQDNLELMKLEYEMQRAQHQRVNLVYTGDASPGQMRYRSDESAIKSSQEALEEKQEDLRIKTKREEAEIIEKEIDDLQKQIDEYEDKISAIDDSIAAIEKEKQGLSDQIELIEESNEALDEQIEKIEETYDAIIKGINDYKDAWQKMLDDYELAENRNLLSMFGYDPDAIIALDQDTMDAFRTEMNAVMGALYADNEGMMKELQTTLGTDLGNYLSATAPLFDSIKTLDLTSINTGIESARDGVLKINNGFDTTVAILQDILAPTASETFEGVTEDGQNAATLIGAAAIEVIDNVDTRISAIDSSIEGALSKAEQLLNKLQAIKDKENEQVKQEASGTVGSAFSAGTVGNAYANGYPGLPFSELALRSEYGQPELTVYPNGQYELTSTPTLSQLPKDTVIFNEDQTRRILKNSGLSGKAYADGNASLRSFADVMPDKAAIFERFEANLQANLDALKTNTFDVSRNVADIAKAVTNNYASSVVINGGINVTCPGVTESEVARNIAPIIQQEFTSIFSGMSLGANQRAMRR